MKVLVYTPDAPSFGHDLLQDFVTGISRFNHDVQWASQKYYDKNIPADVLVTVGWNARIRAIHNDQLTLKKPTISISDGFIHEGVGPGAYHAVTRNGLGAYGEHKTGCPPDRWEALKKKLKPWRTTDVNAPVLVAAQSKEAHDGSDRVQWLEQCLVELRQHTERRILVRGHPNDAKFRLPPGFESATDTLDKLFKHCHAVVTYDSNIVVKAIIAGIPCFTEGRTMADSLCSHDLLLLDKPDVYSDDERNQWAYDIAYTQWTRAEFREGLPWLHVTKQEKLAERLPSVDAGQVPPPEPEEDNTPAEPTPEEYAEQVDPAHPENATVKELLAYLLVKHGEVCSPNMKKAHLIAKIMQLNMKVEV